MLSGRQGSGKTSTAETLRLGAIRLGYGRCKIMKFADTIYSFHEYILNRMETLTGKPRVKKDGVLLQLLGTDWGRKVMGEDIWVSCLQGQLGEYKKNNYLDGKKTLVIIDDCRFENEFDSLPLALRVRLEATSEARKARCAAWRDNEFHASETGLDTYAAQGRFDLLVYTDADGSSPEHVATLILAQLAKNSWMEKRSSDHVWVNATSHDIAESAGPLPHLLSPIGSE